MTTTDYELADDQREAIQKVLAILGPKAAAHRYCTKFNVLRWINAYGNIDDAAKQLQRHLKIRKIKNLDTIQNTEDDFDKIVTGHFPLHVVGRNRHDDNRVLVFEETGQIDIYNIINAVQLTPFMQNRFRIMEKILQKINELEDESRHISSGILLIDLNGLNLQPSLINILKGPYRIMWGTLFEQYPELFSKIVIINAPTFMNVIWAACAPFLDSNVRQKIIITSSNWQKEVSELIDIDCLPTCYGGTVIVDRCGCKPPSPKNYPSLKINPIIPLGTLKIPAGGKLVQVYQFDKDTELEFYLNHQDDFTLVLLYSTEKKSDEEWSEEDLEEVYAACERPGLEKTDYWRWKTPYTGYYYLCFGNEKAWFLSASVQCLISICHPNGPVPAQTVAQF